MAPAPVTPVEKKWALIFNAGLFIFLLWPGLWYLGSVYAVTAQIFLLGCILLDRPLLIPIAARLSQLAAISNAILSVIEWKAADSVLVMLSAAARSGAIVALSVATVVVSETLHSRQ